MRFTSPAITVAALGVFAPFGCLARASPAVNSPAAIGSEDNHRSLQDGPSCQPAWDIVYRNMTTDFAAASTDKLVLDYDISSTRTYEVSDMLKKDCVSDIQDSVVILNNKARATSDGSCLDTLTLSYGLNMSLIAGSDIWNSASNEIEVCQVVRLVEPANGDNEKMVIAEVKQVVTIVVDTTSDFAISNGLSNNRTTGIDNRTTSMSDYVEACKCDDEWTCNMYPLAPNEELNVCITSTSPEMSIDNLNTMNIGQDDFTLTVIEQGETKYPFVSSTQDYQMYGFMVSTMLPVNLFDFGGSNITVSGALELEFTARRRSLRELVANDGGKSTEDSGFQLAIELTPVRKEIVVAEGGEGGSHPSTYVVPLLAVVCSVSILAMAGMAMVYRAREARIRSRRVV